MAESRARVGEITTPVALFIFNRPQATQMVFERLRQIQPRHLLIIADAPRPAHPLDPDNCAAARAIVNNVDWDCQVERHYAEQNMGCGRRIASGIYWVFERTESAIFLEDDCLAHPDFFGFCQTLLAHYRHEEQVMHIGGSRYLPYRPVAESYYFSQHPHCWGWATWRRAWQRFDLNVPDWPQLRSSDWLEQFLPRSAAQVWRANFDQVAADQGFTWDFQWTFACWQHHGLSILPAVNLVSNIGCSASATHTLRPNRFSNLPTEALTWPLTHPTTLIRQAAADAWTNYHLFDTGYLARLRRKLPHHLWFGL
jgi:hypothetical protein